MGTVSNFTVGPELLPKLQEAALPLRPGAPPPARLLPTHLHALPPALPCPVFPRSSSAASAGAAPSGHAPSALAWHRHSVPTAIPSPAPPQASPGLRGERPWRGLSSRPLRPRRASRLPGPRLPPRVPRQTPRHHISFFATWTLSSPTAVPSGTRRSHSPLLE